MAAFTLRGWVTAFGGALLLASGLRAGLPPDDRLFLFTLEDGPLHDLRGPRVLWAIGQGDAAPARAAVLFAAADPDTPAVKVDALSDGDDWVPGRAGAAEEFLLFSVRNAPEGGPGLGESEITKVKVPAELESTLFYGDFDDEVQVPLEHNTKVVDPNDPCEVLQCQMESGSGSESTLPLLPRYDLQVTLDPEAPDKLASLDVSVPDWTRLYFSIDAEATLTDRLGSTVAAGPSDILVYDRECGTLAVFLSAADIGLDNTIDNLDAIALYVEEEGTGDPGGVIGGVIGGGPPPMFILFYSVSGSDGATIYQFSEGVASIYYEPSHLGLKATSEIITIEGVDPGPCGFLKVAASLATGPIVIQTDVSVACPTENVGLLRNGIFRGAAFTGLLPEFTLEEAAPGFLAEGSFHLNTIIGASGCLFPTPAQARVDLAAAKLLSTVDGAAEIVGAVPGETEVTVTFRATGGAGVGLGGFYDMLLLLRDGRIVTNVSNPLPGESYVYTDTGAKDHPFGILPPGNHVYTVTPYLRGRPAPRRVDGADAYAVYLPPLSGAPPRPSGVETAAFPGGGGLIEWDEPGGGDPPRTTSVLRKGGNGSLTLLDAGPAASVTDPSLGPHSHASYLIYHAVDGLYSLPREASLLTFECLPGSPCNCHNQQPPRPLRPKEDGAGEGAGPDGCLAILRGDVDGSGDVPGTTADIIYYTNWAFLGQTPPPCRAAADVDGDGFVGGTTADVIYLAQFLFLGTEPPPDPYPFCGPATPADLLLGCAAPSCP
jgi:hypothetical protein